MSFSGESIAQAFQAAVRVRREQIFEGDRALPIALADSAYTPYLGWVGRNYRGGTVFIAKNPGGGGDSQVAPTALDLEVQRRLFALRDDGNTPLGELLEGVTRAFHTQLPTIGMGVLLGRVLTRLGETLDDVAFVNACPFRTREDEKLRAFTTRESFRLVVRPVVEALRPDTVVYLGLSFGSFAAQRLRQKWTYLIPRARNDRQFKAEAVPVLAAIEADNAARITYRKARA